MRIETLPARGNPRCSAERLAVAGETIIAVVGWCLALVAVALVHLDDPLVHQVALFVHLVSLALGFGGVMAVDLYGLLWLLGRRTAGDLVAMASASHGLISVGVIALLASGAVLHPDLGSATARIKAILVLAILLNGVNAHRYTRRLQAIPDHIAGDAIPWDFMPRALATAAVSQVAWWGTIVIGFLTSTSRS
jgi:hypothetical protein